MAGLIAFSLSGRPGALCRLSTDGAPLGCHDLPRRAGGEIDAPSLAETLARWRPSHAFLAACDGGRDAGAVEAVLSLGGVPVTRLRPSEIRSRGLSRAPADYGRAEAIVRAGLEMLQSCAVE